MQCFKSVQNLLSYIKFLVQGSIIPPDDNTTAMDTLEEEKPQLRLKTDTQISEDGGTKILGSLEVFPGRNGPHGPAGPPG